MMTTTVAHDDNPPLMTTRRLVAALLLVTAVPLVTALQLVTAVQLMATRRLMPVAGDLVMVVLCPKYQMKLEEPLIQESLHLVVDLLALLLCNGPTGASPFSPITPVGIDPSIPRDISVYVQQFKNPGPISAKYGKQVGNQCLLQLDRDLLLNPENMSQIRDQIVSQENMSKIFSKDNSLVTLDGQLDIYGEVSSPNSPSSNQTINTTNSTLDKQFSPTNSTTTLEPKIKTEPPIQLLDLVTIGNMTIAKINNCNQTTLDKLGNFTQLNLESTANVTKQQQPDII